MGEPSGSWVPWDELPVVRIDERKRSSLHRVIKAAAYTAGSEVCLNAH